MNCFVWGAEWKKNMSINASTGFVQIFNIPKFSGRRARVNCTLPVADRFRWMGWELTDPTQPEGYDKQ
jgi:hypothetical protein